MPVTPLSSLPSELAHESAGNPFDAIVVGAGSTGLTAARTLVEHGRRVALIEAGPVSFLANVANLDIRYHRPLSDALRNAHQYAPPLHGGGTFGTNFSCFGGRGLFWNGASPRFRAHDFQGWPLGAADLAAEYAWAETQFRVSTALGTTTVAASMINALRQAGGAAEPGPFALDSLGWQPGAMSAGVASGAGLFFRACGPALMSGALRVATGTRAACIVHNGTVRAVVCQASDGAEYELETRAVVLAAGGIESVRLAGNSRLPDASGRIGVGVQDHLFYRFYVDAPHLYDAVPQAGVAFIPSSRQDGEQWEFHAPGRRLLAIDSERWAPEATDAYQVMARSFAATEKRDANFVEVTDGPLGASPVHFTLSPADQAQRARMDALGAQWATALGGTVKDPRHAAPGGSYHEAGGLDMGVDPASSVVDGEGAFHRMRDVVVADASAFPRIGATNPHLTLVALARRQVTRLAQRLT